MNGVTDKAPSLLTPKAVRQTATSLHRELYGIVLAVASRCGLAAVVEKPTAEISLDFLLAEA